MDANPGDLVVCVDDAPVAPYSVRILAAGRVYRVSGVGAVRNSLAPINGYPAYYLDGVPVSHRGNGYLACRFRKLNDEPDNAELIARIKRPVRKTVSA